MILRVSWTERLCNSLELTWCTCSSTVLLHTCIVTKYCSVVWLDSGGSYGFHLLNSFILGQWAVKLKLLKWPSKPHLLSELACHLYFLLLWQLEPLLKQTLHVCIGHVTRHPSCKYQFCWSLKLWWCYCHLHTVSVLAGNVSVFNTGSQIDIHLKS